MVAATFMKHHREEEQGQHARVVQSVQEEALQPIRPYLNAPVAAAGSRVAAQRPSRYKHGRAWSERRAPAGARPARAIQLPQPMANP